MGLKPNEFLNYYSEKVALIMLVQKVIITCGKVTDGIYHDKNAICVSQNYFSPVRII